ncbi:helix-turn-helix transcriptional regulator [Mycobacterium lacus]|uniref:helix-turn-helix transcriptional regulator n=1 Tax=Mycobacterium lacus TaxID=169765 RepID=UPI001E2D3742|nr:helix-turn-helix transcriptional regulator [Mycobacterium lacus]
MRTTTSTIGSAGPGVGGGARAATHSGPHRLAEPSGPDAIRHERFRTRDRAAAQRFLDSASTPGWEITGLARGSGVTHRRYDAGFIAVDELLSDGKVSYRIQPNDCVVVIQPRAGPVTVAGEPVNTLDSPLLVTDGIPCALQANTARLTVVTVDAKVLRTAARGRNAPLPQHIRFLNSRPQSRALVRIWDRTLDYVANTFASEDISQRPLIVAAAAHLLASAMLECFPSNVNSGVDLPGNAAVPAAFTGAVSFIQQHAGHGIGINDIAAAVRLTPRAVQYLFRQQLNTTPTEYLRRVRLHRAHRDLTSGDRSTTTVTEIAQRWGFAHAGRFAMLYRQTYGESPHDTLKN